jgi:catechol 2,3-dioxygenase-like lactoylglutathione lyase family enzyme
MADHATPNLPALDFESTSRFYQALGFQQGWRDDGWMIMTRGTLTLEFFPYPDLVPGESSFSCCLRLDDLDAFHSTARETGLPDTCWGWPRLGEPRMEESGIRIAYMVDPNGSLIRLIQN